MRRVFPRIRQAIRLSAIPMAFVRLALLLAAASVPSCRAAQGIMPGVGGSAGAAATGEAAKNRLRRRAVATVDMPVAPEPLAGTGVRKSYERISMPEQGKAVAASSALGFLIAADWVPTWVRLAILTYMIWSLGEYIFHRVAMHAPVRSLGDAVFNGYNRLHIQHHKETNKDMTMEEGYDPHGIYFLYKTTMISIAASIFFVGAGCALFHVECSPLALVAASTGMGLVHGLFWNRFHADSHSLTLDYDDGLPALAELKFEDPVSKWLLANHVGHHDIGGNGNYNIVLPGADHVFGTYFEKCPPQAAEPSSPVRR